MKIDRNALRLILLLLTVAGETTALFGQQPGTKITIEPAPSPAVELVSEGGHLAFPPVNIKFKNQLFTRLIPCQFAKPILYPVRTPAGVAVTRPWPVAPSQTEGVADDHPHHKSMWFAHEINGVDFWSETGGRIKVNDVAIDQDAGISTSSNWVTHGGVTICSDRTRYRFGQLRIKRDDKTSNDKLTNWIDVRIRLLASAGDVKLKDTKEGFFAIRTHPDLRLSPDPKRGVVNVFGHAVNSAGQTDKQLWGQTARWVMYYGPVNSQPVSIIMCDHPNNFRHPTPWHARDYGLITANPFGLHDFLKKPAGFGAVNLGKGQSLTLRYRVYVADGILDVDQANALFELWPDSAVGLKQRK